jgi:hypothetical protein
LTATVTSPGVGWSPFKVEFLDEDGSLRCEPLAECAGVAFETASAVRTFPSYRGQRNWPGLWWSATLGHHVGYESWLERDCAMMLDFDEAVTGFASQPFWLLFPGEAGAARRHAPDFFARRCDGTGIVIDCRPDSRIRPRDAEAFAATGRACALLGWEYRREGASEPVRTENVRWLAGYRQPRFLDTGVAARLLAAFADRRALMDGAAAVGPTMSVLPVLFHLLWQGRLRTSLSSPLSDVSLVWIALS